MKIADRKISINKKDRKRVGRGISAGGGKTAGRGTKGQKSRAGHNIPRQFEGGQSNLSLRLPKIRGFKSFRTTIVEISLDKLDKKFKNNDIVSLDSLAEAGLIKSGQKAKILANGELTKVLKIEGVAVSASALKKIEAVKPVKVEEKEEIKSEDVKPEAKKSPTKKPSIKAGSDSTKTSNDSETSK